MTRGEGRPFAAHEPWAYGRPGEDWGATTDDILRLILKELREQVQQGVVWPITMMIGSAIPVPVRFEPGLFSISITNDGPGIVQYKIPDNVSNDWVNLLPNEVIEFHFIKGVIKSVAFRITTPAVAGIRAVGAF